ncbi:hypothetical protein ACDA63_14205 [Uliginosibacterium sp. sgz301328]|uniref:hypothetical protein n=1 Tax=Uliginosibacterium sp. sgz301328 TaxID=3243764 RepID=UPI00359CCDCF
MNVLVVDIGGSFVKVCHMPSGEVRRFESGPHLTPQALMAGVAECRAGWDYDVVSIGYPGRVGPGGPCDEPGNLSGGWVGFDFEAAFERPVKVANDAVLQALGGYEGGKMLFLGLGTGLGAALVDDGLVLPLELGELPCDGDILFNRIGQAALDENGRDAWLHLVRRWVECFRLALLADYVLLGGGNAALVDPLPDRTRRGGNEDAFAGGVRLWEEGVAHRAMSTSRLWSVL